MLVLSRNVDEEVVIGGNIRVHVLSFNGKRVRLGITAPVSVVVDRTEIAARRVKFPIPPLSNQVQVNEELGTLRLRSAMEA